MEKEFIYRYRTITNYTIEELIKDEIVLSSVDTFNDPCDIPLSFSSKDCEKKIFALKNIGDSIQHNIGNDYLSDSNVKNLICCVINLNFNKIVENLKKKILVGCFSSKCDNAVMWSHYCDNRKGFIIQYNKNDINKCFCDKNDEGGNLFQVKYDDKVFDITNEIIEAFNNCTKRDGGGFVVNNDELEKALIYLLNCKDQEFMKAFVTKNKVWEYENEYRILYRDDSLKGNTHKKVANIKPLSIILGDRIELKDKYLLLSIAKRKNLKVYELYTTSEENKFGLFTKEILPADIDKFLESLQYSNFYNF